VTTIYRVGVAVYQSLCPAVPVKLHPPGHTREEKAVQLSPARARGEPTSLSDVLLLMGNQHSMVLHPFQECGTQTVVIGGPTWWHEAARATLNERGG